MDLVSKIGGKSFCPVLDLSDSCSHLLVLEQLVKDVKEECDAEDAVSSSSHVTRFNDASVQTPNKLLRMVAEEICGQSRKPHADRDFKVRLNYMAKHFHYFFRGFPGVCRKIKS